MRHLSALVLIALLVFSPSCKYFKSKGPFGKKERALAVLKLRQDSIRVADSIRQVQDRLMEIERAKSDSIRKAEEDRLAFDAKFKYNIIVGSFITPEYAKLLAEDYKSRGYDTRILKMEGSRFELVSAESHQSFRKAVTRLKQFQDTVQLDAWMYIKNQP
jgi:hypothetical protein